MARRLPPESGPKGVTSLALFYRSVPPRAEELEWGEKARIWLEIQKTRSVLLPRTRDYSSLLTRARARLTSVWDIFVTLRSVKLYKIPDITQLCGGRPPCTRLHAHFLPHGAVLPFTWVAASHRFS